MCNFNDKGRVQDAVSGSEIAPLYLATAWCRETLADREFEVFDFGDGVQVVGHGRWDKSDPDNLVKKVYTDYADDAPGDDSHLVSFHVRFDACGAVCEAYALECDHGQMIGQRGSPAKAPCIRVEYDTTFFGGDYNGVGQFVLIPVSAIDAMSSVTSADDVVDMAFRKLTKFDSIHIIHYSLDELYDQLGNPFVTAAQPLVPVAAAQPANIQA